MIFDLNYIVFRHDYYPTDLPGMNAFPVNLLTLISLVRPLSIFLTSFTIYFNPDLIVNLSNLLTALT